jgi:hypothetical protein
MRPPRRPALRLPKAVEADPRAAALRARLRKDARPLWREGELRVARAPLDDALAAALRGAKRAGQLLRGFEAAEEALAAEEKGQRAADREAGAPRGARVSRLLLLSDDGAERFYRHAEALLEHHAPRVLGLRLRTDAETLGALLFGEGRLARAVLLAHKDAVAAVLLALAEPVSAPGSDRGRSA